MENDFSRRIVFLIGDLCQPYEGDGDSDHGFAGRLSRQLLQLNAAIEERSEEKARLKKLAPKKARARAIAMRNKAKRLRATIKKLGGGDVPPGNHPDYSKLSEVKKKKNKSRPTALSCYYDIP